MDKAIIVDHLSYSNVLKDVSFTIQSGEMVGILGSTNSGKSLILKILAGLIKPTSGFVSMLGYDPFLKSADYLKQISFVTKDKKQLLPDLLPIKSIEITKDMYGVTNREFSKNLSELTQYIKDPALIENLIYKPKILLLDEAILDYESVYQYNIKNNSTTLLTADKIDKLNTLVRRVILIDQGHVVYDGAIDEIITKFAKDKVINATLSSPVDIKLVGEIGVVKKYTYPHLRLACPREVVALAAAEVMQNFPVIDLNIQEMSIDEIISNMKLQ